MHVNHHEEFNMYDANQDGYTGIDYLPRQFLYRHFLFSPLSDEYEPTSGLFVKLEEDDVLCQLTEPAFAEYLFDRGGRCGIAMGYGGLVAVEVHDVRFLWAVFNKLGSTCGMYDWKLSKATLFYQARNICPPNMDFIDINEDFDFYELPFQEQKRIISSQEKQPVLSLIAQNYYMELNDPELTYLPLREINGRQLFSCLSDIAAPLPWAKANYVDGVNTDRWTYTKEVLEKYGRG